MNVIKATGESEPYSEEKVVISIERAGIPKSLQAQVVRHVSDKLYSNIPTKEIYHHIIEFLGKESPMSKARYSLKQAIMALGPTGYPFEDFVAELLKAEGYTTNVRVIMSGKCVSHEIDVVAIKNHPSQATTEKKTCIVEAKFHHMPGVKTDIHVALYTNARFEDVRIRNDIDEVLLITNTKASLEAIAYAYCVGMRIISWSYPDGGGSFRELVEKAGLIPLTVLTLLSNQQKQILLENHVVLCREIVEKPDLLSVLGLSEKAKTTIVDEAKTLF